MSKASGDKIRRWIPVIERIRKDRGLSEQQYPTWILLTIIHKESSGDPAARAITKSGRPGGACGLMQITVDTAKVAGRKNTDHLPSAFPNAADPGAEAGARTIDSFFHIAETYARNGSNGKLRHNYDPEKIAIMWNAGAGALHRYSVKQRDEGQEAAEAYLRQQGGGFKYLQDFRRKSVKWSGGQVQFTGPLQTLPNSGKRQYDAPSSSGVPGCPPHQPAVIITTPSQELAQSTQRTAEEALMVSQEGGATGYKTDPVDPAVQSGQRTRSVRVLVGDRFEQLTALFPAPTEAVDYVKPLTATRVARGFGSQVGQTDVHLPGVEYDTTDDPNQTVHAITSGKVTKVTVTRDRGNLVAINHDGFLVSEYGHLSEVLVFVGDVVATGDIIAKAGQTLGRPASGETSSETLVSVPRARPDPVLYFELRGDVSLFETGEMSSSVDFGTRPLPLDPDALLRTAPAPGTIHVVERVEVAKLKDARTSYAELALTASTPNAQVDAENAYDMTTALYRGAAMANMSRADHFSQETSQRATRTAFGNTALTLNKTDFG